MPYQNHPGNDRKDNIPFGNSQISTVSGYKRRALISSSFLLILLIDRASFWFSLAIILPQSFQKSSLPFEDILYPPSLDEWFLFCCLTGVGRYIFLT